ncbi:hypothetical protein AVEN_243284-1 [Araneus ventricosus]|uniref:Uncharacterized protein n=1 Tax=Araneus ventricosus TaxID=182803 RepID=A0A4Y2Q605_ARAVE|nr:hypothetical protein AVEN_243284-1 [Araneus ventricosus]
MRNKDMGGSLPSLPVPCIPLVRQPVMLEQGHGRRSFYLKSMSSTGAATVMVAGTRTGRVFTLSMCIQGAATVMARETGRRTFWLSYLCPHVHPTARNCNVAE